jgi:hypothetical protein
MELISKKEGANSTTFNILSFTALMSAEVIMECFIGKAENEKINGISPSKFINELMHDMLEQTFTLPMFLLGPQFFDLGLIASHRDVK